MAIARVNSNKYSSASATLSFDAGTSDFIVAAVYRNNGGTLASPQWNGVAMTVSYSGQLPSTNRVYVWTILGGATGTNNLTFTGSNADVVIASYSGVKQTGFPDASTSITPATLSGTQTATLTTIEDNAWQALCFFSADPSGVAAGTGSTLVQNQGGSSALFDSNAALTPAGSKSMSVSLTGSQRASVFSFSFAPDGGGGGGSPTPLLSLMGVGS